MEIFPADFNAETFLAKKRSEFETKQGELIAATRKRIYNVIRLSAHSYSIIELPASLAHFNKIKLVNELVDRFRVKLLKHATKYSAFIDVDKMITRCPSFQAIKVSLL